MLGAGSRVIVAADRGGVGAALTSRLRKLGVEVFAPGADDGRPRRRRLLAARARRRAARSTSSTRRAWHAGLDVRVKRLAALMRDLPESTFLITGTRLGGRHGYDAAGATSVDGRRRDRLREGAARASGPDALIKAVDFAPVAQDRRAGRAAARRGAARPGRRRDRPRRRPALDDRRRSRSELAAEPAHPLTPDTTFVVTGAAGSIVSAITADLAQAAGGGTFHLLDLAPRPDAGDPDLARLATDRDGLKRELAERLRAAGGKPTPKLVERELARIERAAAATEAIAAIERAGGTAHWHAVDLTDAGAVARRAGGRRAPSTC